MEDKDLLIEMQKKKIAEQASIISAMEQEIELLKREIELLSQGKK